MLFSHQNSGQSAILRVVGKKIFISLLLLCLAGCATGPQYETPETDEPTAFLNASEERDSSPMSGWREFFHSPGLDDLLNQADANNLTLQAAWQSVLASRIAVQRFRAAGLPHVDAGLTGETFGRSDALPGTGRGDSGDRFDADGRVGWELDLFGRVRRSVEAVRANYKAEEALYHDLIFTLQADVALHESNGMVVDP